MTNTSEIVEVYIVGGGISLVKSKNIVGYCHCALHRGYMTSNTVKTRDCLEKGCHYLEKYEDSGYWKALRDREEDEKRRKEQLEREKLAEQKRAAKLQKKLDSMKTIAEQLIGDTSHYEVHITKIEKLSNYNYKIFYVTDDSGYYHNGFTKYVAENMKKAFGAGFAFQRVKNIYGEYATWNEWIHRRKWK